MLAIMYQVRHMQAMAWFRCVFMELCLRRLVYPATGIWGILFLESILSSPRWWCRRWLDVGGARVLSLSDKVFRDCFLESVISSPHVGLRLNKPFFPIWVCPCHEYMRVYGGDCCSFLFFTCICIWYTSMYIHIHIHIYIYIHIYMYLYILMFLLLHHKN